MTDSITVISVLAPHVLGENPLHVWETPVALAASLQFIATLPGRPWLEFDRSPNPLREELAREPFAAENGTVAIPEEPGLGIDLDPDAVERYRAGED